MIINCPVCGGDNTAKSTTKTESIPHFGEIMHSSMVCDACGYKHNDVIVLDQKDPIRYELKINEVNLSSRVVKSQSATVSIPELGLKVEPGSKSIAYVSNVEGVLIRFKDAVKRALILFSDDESQRNGKTILYNIEEVFKGNLEVTLIIEDPLGNSKVMDLSVKSRSLTKEELKGLKTGISIIESSDD
ncbi:ZPR1 zinc finger domain-containing protein [Methanobrevibacter filiformis]|uniref:ZPR1 zinc-finger domain protein n=1 Tax=Methanobrevibacter filiformis TaxID=55758 RepID=A0A162FEU5_9EURY|nr:ZPR1 zinc finger domain-containing protein [Methanobrevibacter filiformis]KZX12025.1 ZPR1 zinc-finger domain protein [Methanobrevibacter filiformis]